MLAFHKVLESMTTVADTDGGMHTNLVSAEYKEPKAIGQIFDISYVYSLFWELRLITVPKKVEDNLQGKKRKLWLVLSFFADFLYTI
jgi:hypothetical protein